ncbi:MAG: cation diffusion facilitator family transporter [Deltaproteobacteria bacterium]|nr:cation diffusion facilitator family transporter [Deltaproteobacteria bacterium]
MKRSICTEQHHDHTDYSQAFKIGVALNVGFVIIEVVFGLLADSLALLADAGHNLSDVLGLILAWGAAYLTQREATDRRTYGWRKSSILAALFNAIILLVAIGGIGWEAIRRFNQPSHVAGATIIWVAAMGVIINGITALLFMSGRKSDLNIRGAFLHMAADAGVSAGVVLAGIGIFFTGWQWLDSAVSLLIVAIIFIGTWGLLKDSFNLALDAVPRHIDTREVRDYLADLPGVSQVHDVHIWGMSTTEVALTAHLVKQGTEDDDSLIAKMKKDLHRRFAIDHITIQWERGEELLNCENSCET